MRILEDRGFTFDDIINQIKTDLGFTYDKENHQFKIGDGTYLNIFNEGPDIIEATLDLPSNQIDLIEDSQMLDSYLASLESVNQIMGYFERIGGLPDEDSL